MLTKHSAYSFLLLLLSPPLQADALTDGTLGSQVHLTDPHFTIGENLGQRIGNNLFHSFEHFNVPTEGSATFTGSLGIQNVLARVTGPTSSNIDGTLRSTIPDANLYLMNPNGIRFGEHARLDVLGSFHATTADSIRLGKDGQFNAREPSKSLLTVAPPAAFGFLSEHPAAIEVQGSFLQVPEGKGLSAIGGDLTIRQGNLYAPHGQINLVSVASPGEVNNSNFSVDSFAKLGTITIMQPPVDESAQWMGSQLIGNVDASGIGGGKIFIRAGNFFSDGGFVFADTYGDIQGQGIDISITDSINLLNGARITADTLSSGQGGNITLSAQRLSLRGSYSSVVLGNNGIPAKINSGIAANTYGNGNAGQVRINAPTIELSNNGSVSTSSNSSGNAGDIEIHSRRLLLKDGGTISSDTWGSGKGGNLVLGIDESIVMTGINVADDQFTLISSSAYAQQNGGTINITCPYLEISDHATIQSAASFKSSGEGGQIHLNVKQLVLKNEGVIASTGAGQNNAGSIYVTSDDATLTNSGITAHAENAGGGNIYLTVNNNLFLFNSTITAQANGEKPGDNGGNLKISRPHLFIMDQYSKLSAQAKAGHGGNIKIVADNFLNPIPGNVTATSEKGIDGEVTINAFQPNLAGMLTTSSRNYLRLGLLKPPRWCGRQNRYKAPTNSFAIRLQDMLEPSPSDLRFFSPVWWEE
jgi:filamentous hemagglutinin family protein